MSTISLFLDVRVEEKTNQNFLQRFARFFKKEEVKYGKELTIIVDEPVLKVARKIIETTYPSRGYSLKSMFSQITNTLRPFGISEKKSYHFCLYLLKRTQLLKDLNVELPSHNLSEEELDKLSYVACLSDVFEKKFEFNYSENKKKEERIEEFGISKEELNALKKSIFENLGIMLSKIIE